MWCYAHTSYGSVCVCVCVLGAPKVLSNSQSLEQLNYQACLGTIKFLYVLSPDYDYVVLSCLSSPIKENTVDDEYLFCDTLSQAILPGRLVKEFGR